MFKRGIHIVYAIGVVSAAPLYAVPVVPNFTQGSMTSTTTQTITTSETINSMDYATGWTYSVTGHGVEVEEGTTISPDVISTHSNTVDGVTSTWTGVKSKPSFIQTNPGAAFQFTETYSGPGLSNQTIIQRTTEVESITTTTSIFSQ